MEDQNVHPQTQQGHGAIQVVLIILMIVTLGGIGYVAWMMQVQSDVMAERTTGTEAEVAQLRSELAESERMLAEEKAKTDAAMEAAPQEHVLFTDGTLGFRIVTTPACKDVYQVRSVAPLDELYEASWGVFLPRARQWPTTDPMHWFSALGPEDYRSLLVRQEVRGVGSDQFIERGERWLVEDVAHGEIPPAADMTGSDGKICSRPVAQEIP